MGRPRKPTCHPFTICYRFCFSLQSLNRTVNPHSSTAGTSSTRPDALLLVASGCPHCPAVLQALGELVKAGTIGRLEVVNIGARPDIAQQLGVRSVPWVRLGPFELEGLHSLAELEHWSERAGTAQGLAEYFAELFKTGKIRKAIRLIADDESRLDVLLLLLSDNETELQVRIGIGALLEEFEGEPRLTRLIEGLGRLTAHDNPRIRSDACHFLALTRDPDALPLIRPLLSDPDDQVREVARDSLEHIAAPN